MMKKALIYIALCYLGGIFILACTDGFVNPYDLVDYGDTTNMQTDLDTLSITGLHANIFLARCAVPGCHDGAFEPDFRTVQSSYATLVYHPVTKNNVNNDFQFRVKPYSSEESVLIERLTNCCFVNANDRMPQDNIGEPLEAYHVESIRQWIDDGARDIFDQVPLYPNRAARISLGYIALNEDYSATVDGNRMNGYGTFILNGNQTINMVVEITDDSTAVADLSNVQMAFSTDANNFLNSTKLASTYIVAQNSGTEFYLTPFSTGNFESNRVIYFRFYANDGEQGEDTEFPSNEDPQFYKDYYSFIVQ